MYLQKQGHTVLHVPYFEWSPLQTTKVSGSKKNGDTLQL